jgi:uncharacterized surface protein with fasciclin (FAS1) repeats
MLPAGTVDTLLKPQNKAKLTSVLTYTSYRASSTRRALDALVKKGGGKAELTTAQGQKLTVRDERPDEPAGPRTVPARSPASRPTTSCQSNGVIHVVDHVLLPQG